MQNKPLILNSCTKTCDRQLPYTLSPISPSKKMCENIDHSASIPGVNCGSFYSDDDKLSNLFGSIDEQTLQSEISLGTHAFSEENHESLPPGDSTQSRDKGNHKNSPSATMIQPSSEDNHQNSPTAIETPGSLEENHGMLPLGYTLPNVGSEDEQTFDDELPSKSQNIAEEKEDKSQSESTPLTLITCSVMCVPLYNGQIHVNDRSIRSPEHDTPLVDSATKSFNLTFGQQTYDYHGDQRSVGGYVHKKDTIVIANTLNSVGKFGQHKSTYRGVTKHKWTGKFEAHLWDGNCSTEGRTRKGKQVYLGGYETAEEAARAHDLTALKYWGLSASIKLNFAISHYEKELEEMESMSREELVTFLRRQSFSFTRGSSIYRGVTRNSSAFGNVVYSRNREGHWQARIKVPTSKKDIYLGTFSSEEEAARAYDIAAIHLKGVNALTNFDISNYLHGDLKEIEGFPKTKRVRRSGKSSAITSDSEIDRLPDEGIAHTDSPLDEITRCKISALLPDHPTAVIPN